MSISDCEFTKNKLLMSNRQKWKRKYKRFGCIQNNTLKFENSISLKYHLVNANIRLRYLSKT